MTNFSDEELDSYEKFYDAFENALANSSFKFDVVYSYCVTSFNKITLKVISHADDVTVASIMTPHQMLTELSVYLEEQGFFKEQRRLFSYGKEIEISREELENAWNIPHRLFCAMVSSHILESGFSVMVSKAKSEEDKSRFDSIFIYEPVVAGIDPYEWIIKNDMIHGSSDEYTTNLQRYMETNAMFPITSGAMKIMRNSTYVIPSTNDFVSLYPSTMGLCI